MQGLVTTLLIQRCINVGLTSAPMTTPAIPTCLAMQASRRESRVQSFGYPTKTSPTHMRLQTDWTYRNPHACKCACCITHQTESSGIRVCCRVSEKLQEASYTPMCSQSDRKMMMLVEDMMKDTSLPAHWKAQFDSPTQKW